MPELPEVETLRKHLEANIIGYRIRKVKVFKERIVRPESYLELEDALQGRQILGIHRRGKYLIAKLGLKNKPIQVLIHLGMTGRLFWAEKDSPDQLRHLTVLLECDKGYVCYVDPRIFGRWSMDLSCLDRLGPEPLDSASFHASYLYEKFKNRKAKLKDLLMDQSCVAGLGNIYVCEALHAAGLHPQRQVGQITLTELKHLCQWIRRILKSALKIGESSELSLEAVEGGDGFFYFGRSKKSDHSIQEKFRVYDRESEPCCECNCLIERVMISQRSSYFCPGCQRL